MANHCCLKQRIATTADSVFMRVLDGFGVRHEYGLVREEQFTQRATMPLEEGTISNMWEIAVELKSEYGVRSRASAQVRLGSDSSRSLRMTN